MAFFGYSEAKTSLFQFAKGGKKEGFRGDLVFGPFSVFFDVFHTFEKSRNGPRAEKYK